MTAKIKELETLITALEAEKAAIEDTLRSTRTALYEARREENRAKKLTPAMKDVVKRLVAGAYIEDSRFRMNGKWLETPGKGSERVRDSIFYGLREREIIVATEKINSLTDKYELSDHGLAVAAQLKIAL